QSGAGYWAALHRRDVLEKAAATRTVHRLLGGGVSDCCVGAVVRWFPGAGTRGNPTMGRLNADADYCFCWDRRRTAVGHFTGAWPSLKNARCPCALGYFH